MNIKWLSLLAVAAVVLSVAWSECPYGWTETNRTGMCLKYSNPPRSYADAETDCDSMGGALAMLDTSDKNQDFSDYYNSFEPWMVQSTVWMGASDREEEGVVRWRDGSVVTWSAWHVVTEPDDTDYPTMGPADCMAWRRQGSDWMDNGCDNPHEVVCEWMREPCQPIPSWDISYGSVVYFNDRMPDHPGPEARLACIELGTVELDCTDTGAPKWEGYTPCLKPRQTTEDVLMTVQRGAKRGGRVLGISEAATALHCVAQCAESLLCWGVNVETALGVTDCELLAYSNATAELDETFDFWGYFED